MRRIEELDTQTAVILVMKERATILIVFILHVGTFAQSPADKFVSWSQGNPSLRPYVFFNQPRYSPGDTAYFKVFLFESDSLLRLSSIASVAIVNRHARQVALAHVRVQYGRSHSQIVLPDSLSPGLYRAVAFTDHMVNNPSSVVFEQEFEVVRKQSIQPIASMTFAAEGGAFVRGITNRIIVTATGVANNGACELVDNSGKVITTFKLSEGLGSFHIKPEDERPYAVRSNGQTYALPQAENDGIGILVTPGTSIATIRVIISAPAASKYREDNLQAILTSNGNVHYSGGLNLGDKEFTQFAFPKSSMPSGIATLSIFSSRLELIAERSFYVENYEPVEARLTPAAKTIIQRDKIDVEVSLADNSGKPVVGEFAVTAINQKLFPGSNVAGSASFPGGHPLHADASNTERRELLDLRLASAEPNARLWTEVLAPTKVSRPAGMLLHLKGHAIDKTTQVAVPDFTRIALYLQKGTTPYECMVFDGVFDLNLIADFAGMDEFFYDAEYKGKPLKNVEVRWEDMTPSFTPSSGAVNGTDVDPYADFALKARVINQSYSFYDKGQKASAAPADPNEVLEDEAGGADVVVTIDKFIAFPNMEEVIREIIPSLTQRKQGGTSQVRVFLYGSDYDSKADPLYVIDGLMTRDTEYFMSLKPSNLITIKVIREFNKLTTMGPIAANGIVFVHSKTPDPARVRASSHFIAAQGVSRPIALKTIDHSGDFDSHAPDFRSTLYWNPSIKTDKAGKATISFYASDDTGPVTVSILGLTLDGRPFSGTAKVNVVYAGGNR